VSPLFPVLTATATLAPSYRWRLVDNLFLQVRAPIEGCGAIGIVAATGWARSGNVIFAVILSLSLAVLAIRMLHGAHYRRYVQGGRRPGDMPEAYAWHFTILSLATASLWGGLNAGALLSADPMLQMFSLVVQSGWLGTTCTRNAASPATVLWQGVVVLIPAELCVMLSQDHFLYIIMPFGAIQLAATVGVGRSIGSQLVAALNAEQKLEAANARLTELSATDGLTGIANRRAFDSALTVEWARAARDSTDLGLLLIDVDHFKAYNDVHGHPAGDDCLRLVAQVTASMVRRPPDLAARFGGEEFAAILPGTSAEGTLEVAERIRAAIHAANLAHPNSAFGRVTVSIGTVSLAPHPDMNPQALIDIADKALYAAKDSGRNQTRRGGPPLLGPWTTQGSERVAHALPSPTVP
jgi:diguanylate cyclase (GGDEF)-like protein